MSNAMRRIVISLPEAIIREVDGIVALEKASRSQVFHQAVELYLEEVYRNRLRERLRNGYQDMASLNLALAEEAFGAENEALPFEARSAEGQ